MLSELQEYADLVVKIELLAVKVQNRAFDVAYDGSIESGLINKCLELLWLDPAADSTADLKNHRGAIIQTIANDNELLRLICYHPAGKFTARRIYEIGSSRARKMLERQAWLHGARIDKPELRDLEKFKASLLMPYEAAELDFPRLGGRLADLQNLQ